jgi:hypothetical protein
MERRRLLALAGALSAGLAGCAGLSADDTAPSTATDSDPDAGSDRDTAADGREDQDGLPVPESELVRGAPRDAIPAITGPAFGTDWEGVEGEARGPTGTLYTVRPRLRADSPVVGVERAGEARAYPLAVLNWHEVVNDEFDGPLLVTYCPLCASAVVAERTVAGEPAVFGVSGLLYRQDLVMYDEPTDSLWSQIEARAIRGPRTGSTLELVPSSLTTWGAWREAHPDSRVLRPPPESDTVSGRVTRNYETDPYVGYRNTEEVGLSEEAFEDDRLHPKTEVLGITVGEVARAYARPAVERAGVVNDRVADRPVVVTAVPDGTLSAFDRRIDGRVLAFAAGEDGSMRAGGSRWDRLTGAAIDGPHEGRRLEPLGRTMFWFAWLSFNQETSLWDGP